MFITELFGVFNGDSLCELKGDNSGDFVGDFVGENSGSPVDDADAVFKGCTLRSFVGDNI